MVEKWSRESAVPGRPGTPYGLASSNAASYSVLYLAARHGCQCLAAESRIIPAVPCDGDSPRLAKCRRLREHLLVSDARFVACSRVGTCKCLPDTDKRSSAAD